MIWFLREVKKRKMEKKKKNALKKERYLRKEHANQSRGWILEKICENVCNEKAFSALRMIGEITINFSATKL